MRILICEDSEQNLQSAREFAEKVKGEHEVVIFEQAASAGYQVSIGGRSTGGRSENGVYTPNPPNPKWDCVLTDLYLPGRRSGLSLPGGLYVALAALQNNIPACIITDGSAHGDDELVCNAELALQYKNERLHFRLLEKRSSKGVKSVMPDGKLIKDWEFCFRELMQETTTA